MLICNVTSIGSQYYNNESTTFNLRKKKKKKSHKKYKIAIWSPEQKFPKHWSVISWHCPTYTVLPLTHAKEMINDVMFRPLLKG